MEQTPPAALSAPKTECVGVRSECGVGADSYGKKNSVTVMNKEMVLQKTKILTVRITKISMGPSQKMRDNKIRKR